MTNCVQSLRNYLHLAGLPAFAPYQWYCPGRLDAWQECMIVLSFLRNNPRTGRLRQLLLHVLSDVFDMFDMLAGREANSLQGKGFSGELLCPRAGTWAGMRRLYEQVKSDVQQQDANDDCEEPRPWPSSGRDGRGGRDGRDSRDGRTRSFDVDSTAGARTKKRKTDAELLQISNAAETPAQRTTTVSAEGTYIFPGLDVLTPNSRVFHERNPHSRDGVRPAGVLPSPQSSSSLSVDKDAMTSPRVSGRSSRYPTSLNAVRGATGGGDPNDWLGVIEIE
jgi:hypothetical protein